jgi:Uma2 family endonuclease
MPIPIDENDKGYQFMKTLNEDIKLVSNEYGEYDMEFINGDIVNLTGIQSLHNAIIIAILTRYKELKHNQLYDEFGCRVHELIKANQNNMTEFKMEKFIEDTLTSMRRIRKINWIKINQIPDGYTVHFNITSITDETVNGTVNLS